MWHWECNHSSRMRSFIALNIVFSFIFLLAPGNLLAFCVSDRYTLSLSDTSLGVKPEGGGTVRMQFPATRRVTSHDGLQINYPNVFPKIDLVVYRNGGGFEYDWKVAAGADASSIRVSFQGASYERIGPNGDLILGTAEGEVRHGRPFAYQEINGGRQAVAAEFDLAWDGRVGFRLGRYDKSRPLVIDPALSFVSGIGGSGGNDVVTSNFHTTLETDLGTGLALDGSGNIYIAGTSYSQDFPLVNPLPLSPPPLSPPAVCNQFGCSCPAMFVAKLSPDGTTILYSTLLAYCSSGPPSIAADTKGNVYVAGMVQGGGPFVQVGGGTATANATSDALLVKLDTNGILKAAIAFGGSSENAATSIALDPDGKLYITGTTTSSDFPVTAGVLHKTLSSAQDLFLMKLDPALLTGNQPPPNSILYSTYLGPGSSPVVAADASGNAYVAASTTSTAWSATPGVFQSQCWDASRTGCADVIALKVNPTGSQFIYTTYLGGSETETIGGLALNASGNAYITGTTNSMDFPTTAGAYITQFDFSATILSQTSFAVELSADASHLIYGTLLTTEGGLSGSAIAVDGSGNAWVGGGTGADLLPVKNGIQQTLFNSICGSYTPSGSYPNGVFYCPQAGYLAELNPAGSTLLWATYLGGGNVSAPYSGGSLPSVALNSIVFDAAGNLLVTGNQLGLSNAAAAPSKTNSASVVKITPAGTSLTNMSVQNAAGFIPGLPAPGGLAALYVEGIPSTGTVTAPGLPLPTELAGVKVLVDGMSPPIVAVATNATGDTQFGYTQVNFQVPFEVARQPHIVEVQYSGQSAFVIPQQTGPGIFLLPDGSGVMQHAFDGSLVTVQNPVTRGETLIIYASGLGTVSTPVASGMAASEADPVATCNQITTNAGAVLYAGLTPGFPGLYQVNVQVSDYLPPGVTYINLQSLACWFSIPPPNVGDGNAVAIYIP